MRPISIFCTVLLSSLLLYSCKKHDSQSEATPGPRPWTIYKDELAGIYQWHYCVKNATGSVADTSFAISMKNDSTIVVYGQTLNYRDSVYYDLDYYKHGIAGRPINTADTIMYANGVDQSYGTHIYNFLV